MFSLQSGGLRHRYRDIIVARPVRNNEIEVKPRI